MLEQATGLRAVTWKDRAEFERVLAGDSPGILHLHGHFQQPESIVLGRSSYADVVGDEHARTMLAAMRTLRTLVFVGHGAGLGDPNWKSLLDWSARVFAESERYHYRIVREADQEQLHDPDGQARRILPITYPGPYSSLGPFLRSIVPTGNERDQTEDRPVATSGFGAEAPPPTRRHVLLLVHVGDERYTPTSPQAVQRYAELPPLAEVFEARHSMNLSDPGVRDWQQASIALDRMLDEAARYAMSSDEPITFVIAGRAPHPVFAYLGYRARLMLEGSILFANKFDGAWDRIGPFRGPRDFPRSHVTKLEVEDPPEIIQRNPGVITLFITSSVEHKCPRHAVEPTIESSGRSLSAIYRIGHDANGRTNPLDENDLLAMAEGITRVKSRITDDVRDPGGMVVALSTPAWMAFWAGYMLNDYITGYIDFLHYIPGTQRYVAGLSSDMSRRRWAEGMPRVLALSAEPHDTPKTRSGEARQALFDAVEDAQGSEAKSAIEAITAVKINELLPRLVGRRPDILHIYGHGADHALGLQDERGGQAVVNEEDLMRVLRTSGIRPSLTVLIACHSKSLVEGMQELSEIVVAVDGRARQKTSIVFIGAFYRFLALGQTVAVAFEQARAHVDLQPEHSSAVFELCHRPGTDPADAIFWPKPRT
ncbi:MAG: SIR2 family protein [Myxococcales bacterium]|nr:SIR2 family protein [Myxococcales bacterium]